MFVKILFVCALFSSLFAPQRLHGQCWRAPAGDQPQCQTQLYYQNGGLQRISIAPPPRIELRLPQTVEPGPLLRQECPPCTVPERGTYPETDPEWFEAPPAPAETPQTFQRNLTCENLPYQWTPYPPATRNGISNRVRIVRRILVYMPRL